MKKNKPQLMWAVVDDKNKIQKVFPIRDMAEHYIDQDFGEKVVKVKVSIIPSKKKGKK